MLAGRGFLSEKQGNAPDTRQCNEGINNTGNDATLSAADPRDGIKAEQPDTAPVVSADDDQRQRDFIHDHEKSQAPFFGSQKREHLAIVCPRGHPLIHRKGLALAVAKCYDKGRNSGRRER